MHIRRDPIVEIKPGTHPTSIDLHSMAQAVRPDLRLTSFSSRRLMGLSTHTITQRKTVQVASFSSSRYVLEFIQEPLKQHWESVFIEVR